MSDIDWSKAPEWADAHGLCAFNGEIRQYWLGTNQYQCLDHAKAFPYGGGADDSRHNHRLYQFSYVTHRPAPWTGDGLPPVGAVCEVLNPQLSQAEWEKCTVLFVGKHRILYDSESCSERVGYIEDLQFRPIRTPEQIAEEERKAAGLELAELYVKGGLIAIYDAGWRPRAKS